MFLTLLLVTFNNTVFAGKFSGKVNKPLLEQSTSTVCVGFLFCTIS